MLPPRLIATDLDGTLLRSDGTLGIAVVPATARPLRWLDGYPFLRAASHVVFANGAVVYDSRAAVVIARHQLAPAVLGTLCARIRAAVPVAVFAVETDDGLAMWHEPDYPLRSDLGQPGVRPTVLAELVTRPAVKLLVKGPGAAPGELLAGVIAAAGSAAEPSVSAAYGLVELAAPGVTKASGLAAVAARLGITAAAAVAFGDMPNDLPMLSWAGHAVAVANAHPDVLAAAHEITGTNDADGVASWITARLAPGVASRP